MTMADVLAWAWAFTLPGLLLTALVAPRNSRLAGLMSIPGPVVLLVVAVLTVLSNGTADVAIPNWLPFLPDGAYRARADQLSALMLVILGFVASVVYVYSLGYMANDPGRRRFFVYLDFFVATMALLVLAGNLAVLLIGWTGVGIASFLLISFYRDRAGSLGAGLQALAANAIGDGALLLAAVLLPAGCGALTELSNANCTAIPGGAELLATLIFVAAMAKSAQGPLYFWLPSAMAGPTPISALIHAATMVAAGVYLLVRTHSLFDLAPTTTGWIAAVGVATMLLASVTSVFQPNFKKAIAYSTLAQLGYMFAAFGVGAPFAAFFHLATHAGYKALLFLSAGVVIHHADGEERVRALSGMRREVGVSHLGFFIGSMALIGVPLTSGAWSKDSILEVALLHQPIVGWLLLAGVFLTGLYTGRLYFGVYHGPARPRPTKVGHGAEDAAQQAHGHDGSALMLMNVALIPLMVAAVCAGFVGPFLIEPLHGLAGEAEPLQPVSVTGMAAALLGIGGFFIAGAFELRRSTTPIPAEAAVSGGWPEAFGRAVYNWAGRAAAVHSGRLPRYALNSVLAVAAILFLRVIIRWP